MLVVVFPFSARGLAWSPLRALRDHSFIVGPLRAQRLEPISKSIFDRHAVPEWLVLDDQATHSLPIFCDFVGPTPRCLTLHVVHDVM